MKIAVVGSRNFPDLGAVKAYVWSLPQDTVIVSGGARGVDYEAERAAKERGMPVEIFPADWKQFGKSAGMMRNRDIVMAADKVAAFWDGLSKGTANTIDLAKQYHKPYEIHKPDGSVVVEFAYWSASTWPTASSQVGVRFQCRIAPVVVCMGSAGNVWIEQDQKRGPILSAFVWRELTENLFTYWQEMNRDA